MFENLTNKLGRVFNSLKKRGALTEKDVDEALKDVRIALLEADVSLEIVKDFILKIPADPMGFAKITLGDIWASKSNFLKVLLRTFFLPSIWCPPHIRQFLFTHFINEFYHIIFAHKTSDW